MGSDVHFGRLHAEGKTSIPLHRAILEDERFVRCQFSTRFMEEFRA